MYLLNLIHIISSPQCISFNTVSNILSSSELQHLRQQASQHQQQLEQRDVQISTLLHTVDALQFPSHDGDSGDKEVCI